MNMNSGLILTSGESVEYDINHVGYTRTKGVNETWFSQSHGKDVHISIMFKFNSLSVF